MASNESSNDKASEPVTIAIPLRWVRVNHKSPDHIAARYPYAAYGSNLDIGQMARRCPMADPVGAGTLRGARLVFAYYLGITEEANATTLVGVYRLNAADVASLDRYEGLGRSYDRYLVTVELNGEAVRCFTYLKRDNAPEAPSDRYYTTCLQGYTDWNLDARRLRHAREFARKNQKPGMRPRHDRRFCSDDWYATTFPGRTTGGAGTAAMGDDFIPEGNGTAASYERRPDSDRMIGRQDKRARATRRYEDMTPSEIRHEIEEHNLGKAYIRDSDDFKVSVQTNGAGQTVFTGKSGQRWIKGANGVWRRAEEEE